MNHLPEEIFHEILFHAIDVHRFSELEWPGSETYYDRLKIIRLVCKHWNDLISQHPTYWTWVSIKQRKSTLAYCLKRAGNSRLHVHHWDKEPYNRKPGASLKKIGSRIATLRCGNLNGWTTFTDLAPSVVSTGVADTRKFSDHLLENIRVLDIRTTSRILEGALLLLPKLKSLDTLILRRGNGFPRLLSWPSDPTLSLKRLHLHFTTLGQLRAICDQLHAPSCEEILVAPDPPGSVVGSQFRSAHTEVLGRYIKTMVEAKSGTIDCMIDAEGATFTLSWNDEGKTRRCDFRMLVPPYWINEFVSLIAHTLFPHSIRRLSVHTKKVTFSNADNVFISFEHLSAVAELIVYNADTPVGMGLIRHLQGDKHQNAALPLPNLQSLSLSFNSDIFLHVSVANMVRIRTHSNGGFSPTTIAEVILMAPTPRVERWKELEHMGTSVIRQGGDVPESEV